MELDPRGTTTHLPGSLTRSDGQSGRKPRTKVSPFTVSPEKRSVNSLGGLSDIDETSNKTSYSDLDCKEIKSVNPKGNQHRIFIGRTDVEPEASIL